MPREPDPDPPGLYEEQLPTHPGVYVGPTSTRRIGRDTYTNKSFAVIINGILYMGSLSVHDNNRVSVNAYIHQDKYSGEPKHPYTPQNGSFYYYLTDTGVQNRERKTSPE